MSFGSQNSVSRSTRTQAPRECKSSATSEPSLTVCTLYCSMLFLYWLRLLFCRFLSDSLLKELLHIWQQTQSDGLLFLLLELLF